MKKIIQRNRIAAALAVLLAIGAGNAWAATPVASWTDFRNTTSGNYTWDVSNCTVDQDTGVLTVGTSGGMFMDISGIGSDNRSFSIAIEAEIPVTYSSDATLVDLIVNNAHVSVAANGATIGQCWTDGAVGSTTYGSGTFTGGRQILTFTFQGASGQGSTTYINGTQLANATSLMSSSGSVTHIGIGAFNKTNEVAEGMKIYAVRLYTSKLTAADVTADYNSYPVGSAYLSLDGTAANWSTAQWNVTPTSASVCHVTVTDDTTLNIDAATTVAGIVFNVAEGKTLTLSGSTLTAATITVNGGTVVLPAAGTLSGTIKGDGTVVYDGIALPTTSSVDFDFSNAGWVGTVWLKNISSQALWVLNYCNSNSKLKFTNVKGWLPGKNNAGAWVMGYNGAKLGELILEDDGDNVAFTRTDGYSHDASHNSYCWFSKLSGSGTFADSKDQYIYILFSDISEFSGNFSLTQNTTIIEADASPTGTDYNGKIVIGDSKSATVASGKTWTASNGIVVNGTLTLEGGATMTGAVSGSGTIACNVVDLSGSGFDDSSKWTGTVQIAGDAISPNTGFTKTSYGNTASTLEVVSGHVYMSAVTSLPGTVNVASGATLYVANTSLSSLSVAGNIEGSLNLIQSISLTEITLNKGASRTGTITYPLNLTTLNLVLKENLADDSELTFSVGRGVTLTAATVTLYKPDGTVNNTATAQVAADGHSVTVTYTPTVSGSACWCDYEMTYGGNKTGFENTGTDTTPLHSDSDIEGVNAFDEEAGMLYTYAHPWRDMTGDNAYPSSWTAVVRCTVPAYENAAVITFGTNGGNLIGLVAGANPDTQMKLVKTTGNSAFTTLATMEVQNATLAQHVYVFSVENNSTITVYCDGSQVLHETYDTFTLGGGLQIGSVHRGIGSTGIVRFAKGESPANTLSESVQKAARIDCVRLYKTVLGENAIAALSAEFPAVKLFQATISGNNNEWNALDWTGGDISTINVYSKAIVTVEDDATLTLPSTLLADEVVFEIASGKTLTLAEANGGTTFSVNNPIEFNTGSFQLWNGVTVDYTISGTGTLVVPDGESISLGSSGSISAALTGSGILNLASIGMKFTEAQLANWTGTVELPAGTMLGFKFNDYGNANSTVVVNGNLSGWLSNPQDATAKVVLNGDFNVTDMSPNTYKFAHVTGSGNMSFAVGTGTYSGNPTTLEITVLEDYTGTLANNTTTTLAIGTLARASGTSTAAGTQLLRASVGGTGAITASSLTVGGAATGIVPVFDTDGLYIKAASVSKSGTTTLYNTLSDALTAAGSDQATITLLMPTESAITLYPGQTLVNGTLTSGGVTASANGVEIDNSNGTYTAVDNRTSTWNPGENSDNRWSTASNWSTGRVPSQYTTVTFPETGNKYTVYVSGNQENNASKCAGITADGDVEIRYQGNDWSQIYMYGNIGGTGTLTLHHVCLRNAANTGLTISTSNFVISAVEENEGTGDCGFFGSNGWTISGGLTISGYFKAEAAVSVTGSATIESGAKFETRGAGIAFSGTTTFNGNFSHWYSDGGNSGSDYLSFAKVTVAAPTVIDGTMYYAAFNNVITINDGASFTTSSRTVINSGASFVLAGTGATLIDNNDDNNKVDSGIVRTDVENARVKSVTENGTTTYSVVVDVPVTVDGSEITVDGEWVAEYLSGDSDPAAALAPNSTAKCVNGYNYFANYALGLDPTKTDDKPIVDVTTDANGEFVFTVKHPTFDGEGNITGYAKIDEAANVTTTVTLKYGTDASTIERVETDSADGISPTSMFAHEGVGNVIYYKAEVTIGAK